MKTFVLSALATFGFAVGAGSPAQAQYRPGYPGGPPGGYPGSSPAFSPYLNIVGRGNPAINYFGITRPQMEFRNALFGGQSNGPFEAEDLNDPQMRRGTGHSVTFSNLSHYYNNNPATGGVGRTGSGSAGFGRTGSGAGAMNGAGVSGFGSGNPGSSGRGVSPSRGGASATGY